MARVGEGCELGWCEPVEARVRPVSVVVDPPFFDDLTGLVEVGEQALVETLIAQPAIGYLSPVDPCRRARYGTGSGGRALPYTSCGEQRSHDVRTDRRM